MGAGAGDPAQDLDRADADDGVDGWQPRAIPLPSAFDPDRYQPLSAGSSRLAWLLGTGGLLIPFLSIAGAISGYHAARRGSHRAGGLAVVWCLLTLSISIAFWGPLFLRGAWKEPTTFAVDVSNLRTGVEPPPQLSFDSVQPASSYVELDVTIRNKTGDTVSLSPLSIVVSDQSGGRLAWATDDDAFLATGEFSAKSTQQVHMWVALPAGTQVEFLRVVDSGVEVR